MWLKKYVLPRAKSKLLNDARNDLAHKLSGAITRKKYVKLQEKRDKSARSLQSRFRGHLDRKKVEQTKKKVVKIQSTLRTHLAKVLTHSPTHSLLLTHSLSYSLKRN